MDVLKSRKTNCLHCCSDFILDIINLGFPITFAQVNFRIQNLVVRKVILIKLTKIFESSPPISISYFFFFFFFNYFCAEASHLVWWTGHQKFSICFLKILHLNHFQDVQLLELWMTFCNIHLEYLMADLLCLFALNKVLGLSIIHFVYLQLIWPPNTTFHDNHQY